MGCLAAWREVCELRPRFVIADLGLGLGLGVWVLAMVPFLVFGPHADLDSDSIENASAGLVVPDRRQRKWHKSQHLLPQRCQPPAPKPIYKGRRMTGNARIGSSFPGRDLVVTAHGSISGALAADGRDPTPGAEAPLP